MLLNAGKGSRKAEPQAESVKEEGESEGHSVME